MPEQTMNAPPVSKRVAPGQESRETELARQLFVKLYPASGRSVAHVADMALDAAKEFFAQADKRRG